MLFKHAMAWPLDLASDKAGKSMSARIAMMAMTTSSSTRVKAERGGITPEASAPAREAGHTRATPSGIKPAFITDQPRAAGGFLQEG